MVRISHGVLFLCVGKHTLNGFFSLCVEPFSKLCFSDYLRKIQKAQPDMSGKRLLSLRIGAAFVFNMDMTCIWRGGGRFVSPLCL